MLGGSFSLVALGLLVGVALGSGCGGAGDPSTDWLVAGCKVPSVLTRAPDGGFQLSNGILERSLKADTASSTLYTSSMRSLITGEEKLAAVVAEAAFVAHGVPVLVGVMGSGMTEDGAVRATFHGVFRVFNKTRAGEFAFLPGTRGSRADRPWPPRGVRVEFDHLVQCASLGLQGSSMTVTVVMEMYDGTSALGRRVVVHHACSAPIQLLNMSVVMEAEARDRILSMSTDASISEAVGAHTDSPQHVVSEQRYIPVSASHDFDSVYPSYGPGAVVEPLSGNFTSFMVLEVAHDGDFPLHSPVRGMRTRYGKEISVARRTVGPSMEQYPIAMDLVCVGGRSIPPAPVPGSLGQWCYDAQGTQGIRDAIEQAAEVGFELVVMAQNMNSTWRSFVGVEFESAANFSWFKSLVDLARSKGVEMGAYQLLRNARSAAALNQAAPSDAAEDVLDGFDTMDFLPPHGTGRGCHNHNKTTCEGGPACCSLCAATSFYDAMERSMLSWWDTTGMVAVNQDGAESSTPCSNASHANHHGLEDSVWAQWLAVHRTFRAYMVRNGFIHGMPGHWLEAGQAKIPGGYSELVFSLPRWTWIHRVRERIIKDPQDRDLTEPNAQRMFPIAFVPYHPTQEAPDKSSWVPVIGLESTATIEPLEEHVTELEWALSQAFGTGIFSAVRGYRLFAGNRSKAAVSKWVAFAKRYRTSLITDFGTLQCGTTCWGTEALEPGARCNVTSLDIIIHWTPSSVFQLDEVALAVIWNPLNRTVSSDVSLPLYYSGLSTLNGTRPVKALVREQEGPPRVLSLSSNDTVSVPVVVPPLGITYLVVEEDTARGRGANGLSGARRGPH